MQDAGEGIGLSALEPSALLCERAIILVSGSGAKLRVDMSGGQNVEVASVLEIVVISLSDLNLKLNFVRKFEDRARPTHYCVF